MLLCIAPNDCLPMFVVAHFTKFFGQFHCHVISSNRSLELERGEHVVFRICLGFDDFELVSLLTPKSFLRPHVSSSK